MSDVEIMSGYVSGIIGRVTELHAAYYNEYWSFGLAFEAIVATELSEFFQRYDTHSDRFWTASVEGRPEGCIAIDGSDGDGAEAHLRWFIVSDALRGTGTGNTLIQTALDFCRARDFERIYLWTFEGLSAARHLYEKAGFNCVYQSKGTQWGSEVHEQRFELRLT